MNKFIQTFNLWLGLFTFCNVVSMCAVVWTRGAAGVWLFPLAWVAQVPLVLAASAIHHAFNKAFNWLPARHKKPVRFVLCAVCAFVFMGTYAASQMMYFEIDSFLSWDALRAAAANFRLILPDIIRGMGGRLAGIGALAIAFSVLHTRRYHGAPVGYPPRVLALLCVLFIVSAAGAFAITRASNGAVAARVRRGLLPTTYLTLSLLDDLVPAGAPDVDFLSGLVMPPRVDMDAYLAGVEPSPRPNVFLIMLESVSWDHYGFTGYGRDVSPNLDALAEESVVFTRAYTAAPHSNYAQTSVHASQYPYRRKKLDQFAKVDYPKTMLFDILGAAGYETAFFSAQNEDWQGMRGFIQTDSAIDRFFHSKDELGDDIGIESKLVDEVVRARAVEHLEARDGTRPIFMYLNFQATHFPYDIPADAPRPFAPCGTEDFDFEFFHYDQGQLDRVENKFDNALRYVDAQVGGFIEHLKSRGLYQDSLIVVASDHGEAFYQRGYPTHGTALFDDQTRVALLVKPPGGAAPTTRDDPISLIDVNPTILEVMGWPNHPNFQGRPVFAAARSAAIPLVCHGVIKSHGLVDWPWKYIDSEKDGEWLLNLAEDPAEQRDYAGEAPETLERLKRALRVYRQRQLYYYLALPREERARLYPPRL